MNKEHHYTATITWTGNLGTGTSAYTAYSRNHILSIDGKPDIPGSSDVAFRGDKTRYSPEDSLVGAISACHMLWYLHLCSEAGVVVVEYIDNATGIIEETSNGGGRFTEVTLHPVVTVTDASMVERANALHKKANELCFIANSVNFPVYHDPLCVIKN